MSNVANELDEDATEIAAALLQQLLLQPRQGHQKAEAEAEQDEEGNVQRFEGKKKGQAGNQTQQQATEGQHAQHTDTRLLIVEAFAGSHPVARHFAELHVKPPDTKTAAALPSYHLAAYAAKELEGKYTAPAAAAVGLKTADFLNITGSASDFTVQSRVLDFIHIKLQDSKLDIGRVVVFGGPPCQAYSSANPRGDTIMAALYRSEGAYLQALLEHAAQSRGTTVAAHSLPTTTQAREKAAAAAAAVHAAIEDAAVLAAADAKAQLASDSLVKSFLALFKAIEAECKATDGLPCYLLMENPRSRPDKALWNRPFMHKLLTHLPNIPSAQEIPFRALRQAWLRPVRQNWCTYGREYPKKDTIIFTNLPQEVFQDRVCTIDTCLGRVAPGSRAHLNAIKHTRGAHARAKWPVEFVHAALKACIQAIALSYRVPRMLK